jgi:hypothetical protein
VVRVTYCKNGQPIIDPKALQFGVRYSSGGKRTIETCDLANEALTRLNQIKVKLLAACEGVAVAEFGTE